MKKKVWMYLTMFAMVLTMLGLGSFEKAGAASWPVLSASAYCEFKADKQLKVYRDSWFSARGTASPYKSYNASISRNDVCYIQEITSSYVKVKYPVGSSYRIGYLRRGDLFGVSSPGEQITAQAGASVYAQAGGSSYGSIAKGDQVFHCGTNGSYTYVIYTARSGSRAYKLGYVKTSDYTNKVRKTTPPVNTLNDVTSQFVGKIISIQSVQNGKYLCADGNARNTPARFNRTSVGTWEKFKVVGCGSDIGLRAYNGKYLCTQLNTKWQPLTATADGLNGWERFRIYQKGSNYYFKAMINHKWLCATIDQYQTPWCGFAGAADNWERVRIRTYGDDSLSGFSDVTSQFAGKTISIQSVQNGRYLCADSDLSSTPAMFNKTNVGTWEKFEVVSSGSYVGLKAYTGRYLSVDTAKQWQPLKASASSLGMNEKFKIYKKGNDYYFKAYVNSAWVCATIDQSNTPWQAFADAGSGWERVRITTYNTKTSMTNALYQINISGSKLSCPFDGYKQISGRHEGIDFAYGSGKDVYSLIDGEIIRITEGKRSAANENLSTIAIYDKASNKTVVYLHANPIRTGDKDNKPGDIGIYVGMQVKKGQKIAYEDARGTKSTHTHVEVVNGYSRSAKKSSNAVLENSNPASYWQSKGYIVK